MDGDDKSKVNDHDDQEETGNGFNKKVTDGQKKEKGQKINFEHDTDLGAGCNDSSIERGRQIKKAQTAKTVKRLDYGVSGDDFEMNSLISEHWDSVV